MPNKLMFVSWDEVLERIDLLQEAGYSKEGKWSLGENCNHLASIMELSQYYGEKRLGAFAERVGIPVWVMRFGRLAGWLGIRVPTLPFAKPRQFPDTDDAGGVSRYINAVKKQKCRVNAKSCNRFQLWHCAHHLGYLIPEFRHVPSQENIQAEALSLN